MVLILFFFFKNQFDSSKILDNDSKKRLSKLCRFSHSKRCLLLYRATRDGFRAKDFHRKCDNFENTLVVIKSTEGNVFGGFASMAWNWPVNYNPAVYFVSDPGSYIFSLVNKHNKPFVSFPKSNCSGIFRDASEGPAFGERILANDMYGSYFFDRFDLSISSHSNTKKQLKGFSSLGHGYYSPISEETADRENSMTILAGSHKFATVEIEVFHRSP